MNILQFLDTHQLTGDTFTGPSWETWRAVLTAAYGLEVGPHRPAFERLAGGRRVPERRVRELWCIAGRRAGKTHVGAAIAVYEAALGAELSGTLSRLSPGEVGVVALLAVDRRQAEVALGYVRGLIDASPPLKAMVKRELSEGVELENRTKIEVATSDYRRIRGRTLLAAIFDEVAFWHSDDSANPDSEIHRAAVPALATTGGLLVGISSPYAKRGLLYDRYRRFFGHEGEVLVVQGATRELNPEVPQHVVDEALAEDPEGAQAEWLAQFRTDVASFVARETVEAALRPSPLELPFDRRHRYVAFADPAGGGTDEFTLSIGHHESERIVIDVLRARRGVPAEIVGEYAQVLKSYNLRELTADRYAGSWPADEFHRHGIQCRTADQPKSALYVDALAALNSGRVELPPDNRLLTQFTSLERRTSRGGKDSIDHPPGAHDDRANAVAGLIGAGIKPKAPKPVFSVYGTVDDGPVRHWWGRNQ